ncbi:hypothetical protein [Candidatus Sodalis pierantonius]|uniref:hypothetical protein n=1 Tax=Candidatus Sodalis pierantonii TaxID=1486991 RepID=UPI0005700AFD|nr:hypothetical protein [Candidatus Sodalis pierantonius]
MKRSSARTQLLFRVSGIGKVITIAQQGRELKNFQIFRRQRAFLQQQRQRASEIDGFIYREGMRRAALCLISTCHPRQPQPRMGIGPA